MYQAKLLCSLQMAHAIFGAIGMSKELDLQLYTRRLREMRLANGSETFWARHLGETVLASAVPSLIEFVS
jgi:acyl-CoA dehydrogenase